VKLGVSVVMPVCDGQGYLEESLPALRETIEAARDKVEVLEILAVDDGSQDGSRELLHDFGARVLESGGRRRGPAAARNVGIAAARGDILVFVDCDVAPHRDALLRMVQAFDADDVVAVYGSYDEAPPHPGFASQYMNLRHHHVHQSACNAAETWWAGLGAIRRAPLNKVGGFDEELFPRPSIEDIDLGRKLREHGRIRRCPGIQGTHLKRWSLPEVIRTDILQRALPWSQLMLMYPDAFGDLNVDRREKLRCLLALAFLLSFLLLAIRPALFPVPLVLFAGAILVQPGLSLLFLRANGAWFTLRALLFHQVYYAYAAATYASVALRHKLS